MMEVPEHIDLLIASFLNNEANTEEIQALQEWRALSEANEQYFLDLEFVHQVTASVPQHFEVDVDAAWDKVKAEVEVEAKAKVEVQVKAEGEDKAKPKQFFLFSSAMLRAAVLTLLVGLGFIVYWYAQKTDAPYNLVAESESIQTELPDQTAVILESGSKLTALDNPNERAYALEGEAFFNIHPNDKPFVLYADALRIKDIGTAFRVKAPEANDTIWVEVSEGIVQMEKGGAQSLHVNAGEKAYYLKSSGQITKVEKQVEAKRASFKFTESKLAEVVAELESKFGVSIALANPALAECEITVQFEQEELLPILEIISLTLNLEYEKTGDGYQILGTACTVD